MSWHLQINLQNSYLLSWFHFISSSLFIFQGLSLRFCTHDWSIIQEQKDYHYMSDVSSMGAWYLSLISVFYPWVDRLWVITNLLSTWMTRCSCGNINHSPLVGYAFHNWLLIQEQKDCQTLSWCLSRRDIIHTFHILSMSWSPF